MICSQISSFKLKTSKQNYDPFNIRIYDEGNSRAKALNNDKFKVN
jgi:hypothetical protein